MSLIRIAFDDSGNPVFDKTPRGTFISNFFVPVGNSVRDVISINARGVYTIEVDAPEGALANPSATPPVELVKEQPESLVFRVDAGRLPSAQLVGTLGFTLYGEPYTIGVLVNPASVLVPVEITLEGEIEVDPDALPIGVDFNAENHAFNVWTGGGYTFAFSLPSQTQMFIEEVVFQGPQGPLTYEISADALTAWVRNNYLDSNPDVMPISFDLLVGVVNASQETPGTITVDPTIINNPINQVGSGGGYVEERRPELVEAVGVFAA